MSAPSAKMTVHPRRRTSRTSALVSYLSALSLTGVLAGLAGAICLVHLGAGTALAADATPAAAPGLAADSPVEKRLKALDAQFNEAVERDLMKAHKEAVAGLNASYIAALNQAMKSAVQANNLKEAMALRDEKTRVETNAEIPDKADAEPAGALGRLRTTYLPSLARLESDFQRRRQPYVEKYEVVLINYQKELTRTGDLDGAKRVSEEVTKIAEMNPSSRNRGLVMAKVEIETPVTLFPFEKGQKVYGDREQYMWDELPPDLKGFQYWQSKSTYQGTLKFKVKTPGRVYMACTHRFGQGGVGEDWKANLTSRQQLESAGWKQHPFGLIQALNEGHQWFIFSRECKAGETFSIRTEKYASPFLIVKDEKDK